MDIEKTDSRALSRLLKIGLEQSDYWTEDELAVILRHQLEGPLTIDLESLAPDIESQLEELQPPDEKPFETFADVLFHANPPPQLTTLIKEFAKQQRDSRGLNDEIASFLYVAAICAAVRSGDRSMTSLDNVAIINNIQQLLSFPWLDERARQLLENAVQDLEADF